MIVEPLGEVFVLVHDSLVSSEQPELVTECEIDWIKISITGNRDLYVAAYYMPHRNHKDLDQLDESLQKLSDKGCHTILCGDFNCPDVDWTTGSVPLGADNRSVQEKLVD